MAPTEAEQVYLTLRRVAFGKKNDAICKGISCVIAEIAMEFPVDVNDLIEEIRKLTNEAIAHTGKAV